MRKVLVVDDHPQIRRLIEVNLEQMPLQVFTAENGEEGLSAARAERPDLILLDVIMPVRDGFQMLRDLKADEELRKIPVIMLTVKSRTADVAESVRGGAVYHFPKPFPPNEPRALARRPPALESPPRRRAPGRR